MNDIESDELALFKAATEGTKRIAQDKIYHKKKVPLKIILEKKLNREYEDNLFYFSDEYQPLLQHDPIRYLKDGAESFHLKRLRIGFYDPVIHLDLHGLRQLEAKQEIASLITVCLSESLFCASIMYGHGKHILKGHTPLWLAQHPSVLAFHQAPKTFGGDAALLVLFDVVQQKI